MIEHDLFPALEMCPGDFLRAFFMPENDDIGYMRRAIGLAGKGFGFVNPNPPVGAVIVKEGKIIGEGFHQAYGKEHAEINAMENAVGDISGATLYVTLEPCNHYGKTPPCTDRIIRGKIGRVVYALNDPNPSVPGGGSRKLMEAGIRVDSGICRDEAAKLSEVYFKYITTGRPFGVMKSAMTLDGRIATSTGQSKWISGPASRSFVHRLRHLYSGIMVGVDTVIADDPELTDRSDQERKSHPVRIILDSKGRTPAHSRIMTDGRRTIFAVTAEADPGFLRLAEKHGKEVIVCKTREDRPDPDWLMEELGKRNIDSVLTEGGATVNFSALEAGIIDKIFIFLAPVIVGGDASKGPVGGKGFASLEKALKAKIDRVVRLEEDIMIEAYLNKNVHRDH